ncbi:hypothetical protein HKD37_08G022685 [Glycine soja]
MIAKKENQDSGKGLSQVNKTNEPPVVEKLREEVASLTKDFRKFLESSNNLIVVLKSLKYPHGKFGLGLEKGISYSKTQFESTKCDLCCMSGHSKFRCIHKKNQMSKGTNIVPITNILGKKRPWFKLVSRQWMLTTLDGGKVYVPRPKAT